MQRRTVGWSLVVAAILGAAASSVVVGADLGALDDPQAVLFGLPDAKEYREVGAWLVQGDPWPEAASARRPIFYSALTTLAAPSPWCLVALQGLFVAACAVFLYLALRRRAGPLFAAAGPILLLAHPSLHALPFRALAESLVLALLSLALWLASRGGRHPQAHPGLVAALGCVAGFLTLAKPVYQLHVGLLVALCLGLAWRRRDLRYLGAAVAALSPIALQLVVAWSTHGRPFLSTIGADTLRQYFWPLILDKSDATLDFEGARAVVAAWQGDEAARLLREQPALVGRTFIETIFERNLEQAGADLSGTRQAWSWRYNQWLSRAHLVLVPWVALVAARRRDVTVLGALTAAALVVLTSGITFWQGDRIIIVALPLFLFAYLATLAGPARDER